MGFLKCFTPICIFNRHNIIFSWYLSRYIISFIKLNDCFLPPSLASFSRSVLDAVNGCIFISANASVFTICLLFFWLRGRFFLARLTTFLSEELLLQVRLRLHWLCFEVVVVAVETFHVSTFFEPCSDPLWVTLAN